MSHHRAARVAITAHHVEHTRWQKLCCDLGQQHRGGRRGVAGLQHNAVACGDGWRKLPDRHHHRIIPRCHLGTHTHWLATNHRGETLHVFPGALAFEHARSASKESNLVNHRRDFFSSRDGHGLAAVFYFEGDEFVLARFDGISDAK